MLDHFKEVESIEAKALIKSVRDIIDLMKYGNVPGLTHRNINWLLMQQGWTAIYAMDFDLGVTLRSEILKLNQ